MIKIHISEKQSPSPPRLPTPPPIAVENNAKNFEDPVSDVAKNPEKSVDNENVAVEETHAPPATAGCVGVEVEDTSSKVGTEITKMQMSTKFAVPESRGDINVNNKDNKSEYDGTVKDAREEGVKVREESPLGAETRRSAFTRLNKSNNARIIRPQDVEEVVGYLSSIDQISKPETFRDR